MILIYHRIADVSPNDWTASTQQVSRQVDWLRRNFDLVSLAEAQTRVAAERNDRPAVSITFDDGYGDNCRFALPLLASLDIPCTYFISTRHILDDQPFPHDVAAGRPLLPNTPAEIRALADAGVEIGGHTRHHVSLGPDCDEATFFSEIVAGKREVEQLSGRAARFFAFPYGQHVNMCPRAFEIVREAGYEAACSAYGGYNFAGDDPFHLQRIHVDNDLVRLQNWTRSTRASCG